MAANVLVVMANRSKRITTQSKTPTDEKERVAIFMPPLQFYNFLEIINKEASPPKLPHKLSYPIAG